MHIVSTQPQIVALAEAAAPSGPRTRQTILRQGEWKHPKAPGGRLVIDKAALDEIARNFGAGVGLAGDEIPAHIGHTEHVDDRAVAWAKVRVVPDEDRPGQHKLVAEARHTDPETFNRVRRGEYRYVSPTLAFNHRDPETGKTHGIVLRNYAYTNYPFIKRMGDHEVVNLSEVEQAEVALAQMPMIAADGGPRQGDGDPGGLPPGEDVTDLPKQCLSCARLGKDCPFAAKSAEQDLALKQAAAASGNCPQFVEQDSNQPGGAGDQQANLSPANARPADAARVGMSETTTRKVTPMKKSTEARLARLAELEAEEQRRFEAALAEKHKLPAAALNVVLKIGKAGATASVALAEALDAHEVALSEKNEGLPEALAQVDLSESVVVTRAEFRELVTALAEAQRTDDPRVETTQHVDGKPGGGEPSLAVKLSDPALDPKEAARLLDEAQAAGLI